MCPRRRWVASSGMQKLCDSAAAEGSTYEVLAAAAALPVPLDHGAVWDGLYHAARSQCARAQSYLQCAGSILNEAQFEVPYTDNHRLSVDVFDINEWC